MMSTRLRSPLTMPALFATLLALVATLVSINPQQARAAGYPIGGKILEEYNQAGGAGFFGDAITREADAGRGGRFQKFYKNSSIYWHPLVSNGHAQQIGGAIRDKWGTLGWENGSLRYPTTRELNTRRSGGKFNRFEGGNVYWSSETGTHPVWGRILEIWGSSDYEVGYLGFPTSDEYDFNGGKAQDFQGGRIDWLPSDPASPQGSNRTTNPSVTQLATDPSVNTRAASGCDLGVDIPHASTGQQGAYPDQIHTQVWIQCRFATLLNVRVNAETGRHRWFGWEPRDTANWAESAIPQNVKWERTIVSGCVRNSLYRYATDASAFVTVNGEQRDAQVSYETDNEVKCYNPEWEA